MNKFSLYLCLILVFCLGACKSKNPQQAGKPQAAKHQLVIYSTDQFRTSGLESTIIPEFQKKYSCKVDLVMFSTVSELCQAIKNKANYGKYDLALGMDASFAASESLATYFVTPDKLEPEQLSQDVIIDPSFRLIPYAYANMALLYNTSAISNPPQSFGELQDARYLHQMAICDPKTSGLGRSTLFWSLALFGLDGYEHFWKSLRKNIYKSFSNPDEALAALKRGECNLMLGLNTTPAYWQELDPGLKNFDYSTFKEGSYLYVQCMGMHRGSANSAMAGKFINHFLSAETQKMVVYKLGMFPANRTTMLPMHFSSIPFISYSVNSRLSQNTINGRLAEWLEFWDRLFGYQIS